MSWRIAIEHSTTHTYHEVSASYHEARVIPLTLPRQICLDARVEIHPAARAYRYWDYWGSVVTALDIHTPHIELTVVGTSVVETSPPPPAAPVASWAGVASPAAVDEYAELLAPTEYAPLGAGALDELDQLIDDLRGLPGPDAAARQATEWVRSRLRYQAGADRCPHVGAGGVAAGSGDLPGLRPRDPQPALAPASPPVGERHVLVARGRDYADVPPLKGIYHGAPAVAHHVEVGLTRLG